MVDILVMRFYATANLENIQHYYKEIYLKNNAYT